MSKYKMRLFVINLLIILCFGVIYGMGGIGLGAFVSIAMVCYMNIVLSLSNSDIMRRYKGLFTAIPLLLILGAFVLFFMELLSLGYLVLIVGIGALCSGLLVFEQRIFGKK